MARKGVFPIVATLAVVGVVLAVFSQTVMRDSNISTNTMTTEQAYADLSGKMKRIGVQKVSVNPQQLDVSEFLDAKDELPDIDSSYPFVVEGNGDVNIEIFSSGEKAAESGSDSFLTSMAKKFNAQHNKTSGDKTMSVSLRSVPSGTAAEYISTGKYQPECYTPSNTLFGELVKNEGVELTVEADRLAGNVAGILVSKKTGDMLRSEYGEASVSSVLNATIDGKLMMGYSNPYTSATGLHIDYDAGTMTFNDEDIDLNPNLSEVAKNIKSIQKFFSGMDYFYGDVEQAKKDYFKYMTWYLATPFMAYLRYFASRNNYDTKLFPMYGVIYGDSNGGKTTFIKFLVKLMCGETVKMNTTEDFTATRIDGLKRVCEGLPLNIDDLAKTQFQNHSERVIKNDEWGISDMLVNYPAVSITSNKITSLTKDLSKRAIICRIGAKIDNERGAKNSKRVNESMSELTTAFYGEYVRRMLVCIDEMTTEMRENANGKEYFPDIFHASSSVIADIFEACGIDLPDYVRILYYNDYMGDESIGRAAIEKIELAWQADPSKFRVDKKQNRLIYTYPQDGPWYELKYIADELPNSLEAEISGGNQLIMNYEQAQELFGIKFRRWLGIFNL